jgi:hypothetical protein
MSCLRVKLRDLGRYQKKYPLVRHEPRLQLISDKIVEIENLILDINNADTVTAAFEKPFTSTPNVVVGFISLTSVGNVNVYTEAVSINSVTVRTSSPVTGKITVQAMYIGN